MPEIAVMAAGGMKPCDVERDESARAGPFPRGAVVLDHPRSTAQVLE
jgi:hypothetical protein